MTSMPTEVGGWTDDGRSFVVNEELASRTVLPQYFSHTNFRSFARQLACYGFRKTRKKLAYANGHVRFVLGLVRDGRSGPIDVPPERCVGGVSALSRAVEGRPARGDAHVAAPVTSNIDRDKA